MHVLHVAEEERIRNRIHGSKGFNGQPIVTCDDAIVTAKRCRLKGFDVRPIVTCDDGIITAWVHGLKGFNMWLIVLSNWVSPDIEGLGWRGSMMTSHLRSIANHWSS